MLCQAKPSACTAIVPLAPAGVEVRELEGDATALVDAWSGAEHAVVVDAAQSGAEPGTIRRFDAGAGPLPVRATWKAAPLARTVKCSILGSFFASPGGGGFLGSAPCLARHPRLELAPTAGRGITRHGAWRGGRVVECTALEMRHRCKPIGGSNPSLSASQCLSGPDT